MTVTQQSQLLVETHRQIQARNAAIVALLIQRLFGQYIDVDNLIESAEQWLQLATPLVVRGNENAASLARSYYSRLRALELVGSDEFNPDPIPTPTLEQIRTSLWVTGISGNGEGGTPEGLQRKLVKVSGLDISPELEKAILDQAVREAGDQAAGATARHVGQGSRDQIIEGAKEDKRALGWFRVTRADPCYFCAMLASRGPVYKDDSFEVSNMMFTGEGTAKAHDQCVCSMKPIFDRKEERPGSGEEFWQLWLDSTAGKGGYDALNAFRSAYNAR